MREWLNTARATAQTGSPVGPETDILGGRESPHTVRGAPLRWETYVLAAVLGLSLLVQLLAAPYQGFAGDLQLYLRWGWVFDTHPLTVYTLSGANYPPLTIYIFGGLELVYHAIGHVLGYSDTQLALPLRDQFSVLWFVAKLPIIAANLGASWLIFHLARQATSAKWALLAASAYALAPSMLLDGAVWGQTDGVPVFLILLAIVAIQERRHGYAGVLLGLSIMLKPQPVIFVPIVLVYILVTAGWRDWLKSCLTTIATVVLICSPFLLPPNLQLLVFYHNTVDLFAVVTSFAYNLWYLIEGFTGTPLLYNTTVIGTLTASTVGLMLFAPIYGLALVLIWRRRSLASVYIALSIAAIGFFELTALQRERYLFQALVFLLLAAVYYRTFVLHFAVASVTVFVNILIVASIHGVAYAKDPRFMPLYQFFAQHPQISLLVALLNLELLLGVIGSSIAWTRSPLPEEISSADAAAPAPLALPGS